MKKYNLATNKYNSMPYEIQPDTQTCELLLLAIQMHVLVHHRRIHALLKFYTFTISIALDM